jgi:FOG: CheY-like receiver
LLAGLATALAPGLSEPHLLWHRKLKLTLCYIGLPDGSGYEVVSEAKRRHPVKAVAITGFGTEADVRRSTEAGFDFHLVKPVDLRELQDVLDEVGTDLA